MKILVYKAWKMLRFKDKSSEDLLVPSPGGAKIEIRLMGETWHKNRSSLKVVLFVFKIFKMLCSNYWSPVEITEAL